MLISEITRAFSAAKRLARPRIFSLMTGRLCSVKNYEKEYDQALYGDREQVGYGWNGEKNYSDRADYPFPSIRYKECTPEVQALKGKERGDWRLLSQEEKRELYRVSFRQTFAEFQLPTGEWKTVVGVTIILCCLGIWIFMMEGLLVYEQRPDSFTEPYRMAQMRRQIDQRTNPIEGLSSWWDYEKREWKNVFWFNKPPNPFIDPKTGTYYDPSQITYEPASH